MRRVLDDVPGAAIHAILTCLILFRHRWAIIPMIAWTSLEMIKLILKFREYETQFGFSGTLGAILLFAVFIFLCFRATLQKRNIQTHGFEPILKPQNPKDSNP